MIHNTVNISPFAIIGFQGDTTEKYNRHKNLKTVIKKDVFIGPFVTIYEGAYIEENVKIDPYCRVGHNTIIGKNTRLLYGVRIHDDVTIGSNCIIGGNCSNRVSIGNNVVHFGRIAHKFNQPHLSWTDSEEPSLLIDDDSVIGANALLIGNIKIGKKVYIAAGEIIRKSIPDYSIFYKGKLFRHKEWKGSLTIHGFWE
jgi:UDP-3-O-[3-hydroxymyristoyl] glucosamine N-acyltransferase